MLEGATDHFDLMLDMFAAVDRVFDDNFSEIKQKVKEIVKKKIVGLSITLLEAQILFSSTVARDSDLTASIVKFVAISMKTWDSLHDKLLLLDLLHKSEQTYKEPWVDVNVRLQKFLHLAVTAEKSKNAIVSNCLRTAAVCPRLFVLNGHRRDTCQVVASALLSEHAVQIFVRSPNLTRGTTCDAPESAILFHELLSHLWKAIAKECKKTDTAAEFYCAVFNEENAHPLMQRCAVETFSTACVAWKPSSIMQVVSSEKIVVDALYLHVSLETKK